MQPLKIGSNNADVRTLQIELNKLGYGLATDGIYGAKTAAAVADFTANEFGKSNATNEVSQSLFDLIKSRANPQKFVVVLDAGHGGIDPKTGLYTTPASNGKRYHHPNAKLHSSGWFLEGVENRIIANALAEKLTAAGVQVVKAYHEFTDLVAGTNEKELLRRGTISEPFIKLGYKVLFYSIHSNAAPTSVEKDGVKRKRTKPELDKIRGFEFYSTKKDTLSDKGTAIFAKHYRLAFGEWWQRSNGEKDADFGVLRPNENNAIKHKAEKNVMAVLAEIGVFTSQLDAEMLVTAETRKARVNADFDAIIEIKNAMVE